VAVLLIAVLVITNNSLLLGTVVAAEPTIPPTPTPASERFLLEYNAEAAEFTVSLKRAVGSIEQLEYRIYYRTAVGSTQGAQGKIRNREGETVTVDAGTCSGSECVTPNLSRGIVKVGPTDNVVARTFVYYDEQFSLGTEEAATTLDLTADDQLWLESDSNSPTPSLTPTPSILASSPTPTGAPAVSGQQGLYPKKKKTIDNPRKYTHADKQAATNELVTKRTESSKTFLVTDPDELAQISASAPAILSGKPIERIELYQKPVHAKRGDSFTEIDNRVVVDETDHYTYRNAFNRFTFRAGNDVESGVEYTDENGKVCRFALQSVAGKKVTNSTAMVNENRITYPNVYKDADLEFTVTNTGVRTEIVAKKKTARKGGIEYALYQCDGIQFEKAIMSWDGGAAEVAERKSTKKKQIYDATGVSKEADIATLTVEPDYSKVTKDGEVRIDPTLGYAQLSKQTFISANHPWTALYAQPYYVIGNYNEFSDSRFIIRFDMSPLGTYTTDIIGATLKLNLIGGTGDTYVRLKRVTSDWSKPTTAYPGPSTVGYQQFGDYGIKATQGSQTGANYRNISIPKELIDDLKAQNYGGYGFTVEPVNDKGIIFCPDNTGYTGPWGTCSSPQTLVPTLNVYTAQDTPNPNYGQRPSVPLLKIPASGQNVYPLNSQLCNESVTPATGTCRQQTLVTMTAETGDPDGWGPGDILFTQFAYTDTATVNWQASNIYGTHDVSAPVYFPDGSKVWTAVSVDKTGQTSAAYATAQTFRVDTTPPNIPALQALPEFTNTTSVTVTGTKTTDNTFAQDELYYRIRYSESPSFSTAYTSPTQRDQVVFQIPPIGFETTPGVTNTNPADDIKDETTYYYQISAQDRMKVINEPYNVEGNKSGWSATQSTTIDTLPPRITAMSLSETRFSPNASPGIKDTVAVSTTFTEKYPQNVKMTVRDLNNTVVYESVNDQSSAGTATDRVLNYTWDGKNTAEQFVADGAYIVKVTATDKAGNTSQQTASNILIVDNTPAQVLISSPFDDFWTNRHEVVITGQVPLGDLATCEYSVTQGVLWTPFLCSGTANIFTLPLLLGDGVNDIWIRTTDVASNQYTKELSVTTERDAPVITIDKPDYIGNTTNEIRFTISDPDYTASASGGLTAGVSMDEALSKIDARLQYRVLNTTQPTPYPTTVVNNQLIQDGVIVDTGLLSGIDCTATSSGLLRTGAYRDVTCTASLSATLQPDAEYSLTISANDLAGNEGSGAKSFTVDTQLYHVVESAVNGAVYSTDEPLFQGTASKGSTLTIRNTTLDREKSVILDEALNGTGADSATDSARLITQNFVVTCGEYRNIDNQAQTPDEEVCTWSTRVLQQSAVGDVDTSNTTILTVSDTAGNTQAVTRTYTVNLHGYTVFVDTSSTYFSPNGDGQYDGIQFAHAVHANGTDILDPLNPPAIASWEVKLKRVKDASGQTVGDPNDMTTGVIRTITGDDIMPYHSPFDGKDENGDWVPEGEYVYELSVTTADAVTKKVPAPKRSLFARNSLSDEVLITSPITGTVLTGGAMHVVGMAPATEDVNKPVTATVCLREYGAINSCLLSETITVNTAGYFDTYLPLPQLSAGQQKRYILTGSAKDHFGNVSDAANQVEIFQDTVAPFVSVQVVQTLTGTTNSTEYQRFLNGEIGIDSIRSVYARAVVAEKTEKMEVKYADYTNFNEGTPSAELRHIGLFNNRAELDPKRNPGGNAEVRYNYSRNGMKTINDSIEAAPCAEAAGCTWGTYIPMKPTYGGIYDVVFVAKRGNTVASQSASFQVDNSTPAAPAIMIVEKWDATEATWAAALVGEGSVHTATPSMRLRGAAEPGTKLEVKSNGQLIPLTLPNAASASASINVSTSGIWEATIDLSGWLTNTASDSAMLSCATIQSGECKDGMFALEPISFELDGNGVRYNETASPILTSIHYDTIKPRISAITPEVLGQHNISPWGRYGNLAIYTVQFNEMLHNASILKRDNFLVTLQDLGLARTWAGNVVITNLLEGYFHTTVFGTDLAGNVGQYRSEDFETDNTPDFRVKVDHTAPVVYGYNWHTWGYQHGGKNSGNGKQDVYIGMLNRGYVTRSQTITLTAKAEVGQRAQFLVNGSTLGYVDVTANNCTIPDTAEALEAEIALPGATTQDKYTADGLLVRTAHQCNASIDYTFTDDGANAEGGEPKHGYLFEMKVLDKAGNESNKSKEIMVYHDTVAPKKPKVNRLTADYINAEVERYAETEFVMFAPDGTETNRALLRADKFGKTENFDLIYHDAYGDYKVEVTSWDQAGNVSERAIEVFRRIKQTVSYGDYTKGITVNLQYIRYRSGEVRLLQSSIPAPILYSQTKNTDGSMSVNGYGVKKKNRIIVQIWYEYGCFITCKTGYKEVLKEVQHAEWIAYKTQNQSQSTIAQNWNDDENGKFTFIVNDLDNSYVSAKSKIHGTFSEHLPINKDGVVVNIDYSNLESNLSNQIDNNEDSARVSELKEELRGKNVFVGQNDGTTWNALALILLQQAVAKLPASFYAGTSIILTSSETDDNCGQNAVSPISQSAAYVEDGNRMFICTIALTDLDNSLVETYIHEFAHIKQIRNSDNYTHYGLNVVNQSTHSLYKYYDILFNSNNNSWNLDTTISSQAFDKNNCYKYDQPDNNGKIFVSSYACRASYIDEYTNDHNTFPEEEMAESYTEYVVNLDNLRQRDKYLINGIEYDLNRRGIISTYFNH
jgi:hypothetical protein